MTVRRSTAADPFKGIVDINSMRLYGFLVGGWVDWLLGCLDSILLGVGVRDLQFDIGYS